MNNMVNVLMAYKGVKSLKDTAENYYFEDNIFRSS